MEAGILKVVAQVAGLGGIALGVLLLVFREVIRKNIFPILPKQEAYKLLRLIIILVWTVALVGIVAWVYTSTMQVKGNEQVIPTPTPKPNTKVFASEDEPIYRKFDLKNKKINFKVKSIIINNAGDADDIITIKALLKIPDLREEDISHSYGSDFEIVDQNGKKLTKPFVLPKGANLTLNCSINFIYSERSADVFEKEGMRRLTITFSGKTDPPPSLSFCYEEDSTLNPHEFYPEECPKDFNFGG
jgi:hypothetical protein